MTPKQLQAIQTHLTPLFNQHHDPIHDLAHIQRVAHNAQAIAYQIPQKLDSNLLTAICYLHDISHLHHPPTLKHFFLEGCRSLPLLQHLLPQFNLSQKDQLLILEAVRYHPHAFPFKRLNRHRSLYTQIIQDADLIDQFSPQRLLSFLDLSHLNLKQKVFYKLSRPLARFIFSHLDNYLNLAVSVRVYAQAHLYQP